MVYFVKHPTWQLIQQNCDGEQVAQQQLLQHFVKQFQFKILSKNATFAANAIKQIFIPLKMGEGGSTPDTSFSTIL